jgi:hypothetical protein
VRGDGFQQQARHLQRGIEQFAILPALVVVLFEKTFDRDHRTFAPDFNLLKQIYRQAAADP